MSRDKLESGSDALRTPDDMPENEVARYDPEMHGPITLASDARTIHLRAADMNLYYRMPEGLKGRWFITVAWQEDPNRG